MSFVSLEPLDKIFLLEDDDVMSIYDALNFSEKLDFDGLLRIGGIIDEADIVLTEGSMNYLIGIDGFFSRAIKEADIDERDPEEIKDTTELCLYYVQTAQMNKIGLRTEMRALVIEEWYSSNRIGREEFVSKYNEAKLAFEGELANGRIN
jgi:hypothetical protein